jgi:hypothetical protein
VTSGITGPAGTAASSDARPRVLLVTGFGRSGTTLVNTILGSTPGIFAAGEVRFLWARGLLEGRRCGCGRTVQECPVWGPALEKAFGHPIDIDAAALVAEDSAVMRTRHLPWLLGPRRLGDHLLGRLDALPAALTAVYRSLHEVTGARLIVDTSKPPSFGIVLQHLDEIDLRVLHVVRDPRAVAYSWTRSKALTDGARRQEMLRLSPPQSALQWDLWNGAAERLWRHSDRYLRVRYEDLVADPRAVLGDVTELAGVGDLQLPFTGSHEVAAGTVHAVAGNADRMRTGPLTISTDDEWRRRLPASARRVVTALTWPLAARYGYRSGYPAQPDHRPSTS